MGIKGLIGFLNQRLGKNLKGVNSFNDLNGKVICFDAFNHFYKVFDNSRDNISRQKILTISRTEQFLTPFIFESVFKNVFDLVSNGIIPVFVFDGKAHELKKELIEKNRILKEHGLRSFSTNSKAHKNKVRNRFSYKGSGEYNHWMIMTQIRELLVSMGIPLVTAPQEAEAQCAFLCKNKLCYGTVTNDVDVFPLGCDKVIRELSPFVSERNQIQSPTTTSIDKRSRDKTSRTKEYLYIEYNLSQILNLLKLDQQQFVDFCILLGSDFAPGVQNLSVKDTLTLLRQYGTLEEMMRSENQSSGNYKIPDRLKFNLHYIRDLYLRPKVDNKIKAEDLRFESCNVEKLLSYFEGFGVKNTNRFSNEIKRLEIQKLKINASSIN